MVNQPKGNQMKESIEFLVVVEVEYDGPDRNEAIQAAEQAIMDVSDTRRDWFYSAQSVFQLSLEQSQAIRRASMTGDETVLKPQTAEEASGTIQPILGGPDGPWFVADSAKQNA